MLFSAVDQIAERKDLEFSSCLHQATTLERNGEEICSMRSRKAGLSIRHLKKRSRKTQFIFVKNISSLRILKYVSNQVVLKLNGARLQILIEA